MRIAVVGMGYVGAVSAACFAKQGHQVVGIDTNERKVSRLKMGDPGFHEPGLKGLLAQAVESGQFSATQSLEEGVREVDVIQVSVGTPTGSDGGPELGAVFGVARDLANYLVDRGCTVLLRSTVPPGTTRSFARILGEPSDVNVVFCPEFLREGQAVDDFFDPPYTILGVLRESDSQDETVVEAFSGVDAPLHWVAAETGELLKLASNAWHGNKVAFANEVGRLAESTGSDGSAVMDLLASDTKLNTSDRYMKPGFVFGGSCLPKDIRALRWLGGKHAVETPLMNGVLLSNASHLDAAVGKICRASAASVGIYGLAFKPGTDDLRESGAMMLATELLRLGIEVRIYDELIRAQDLIGTNLGYALEWIPDLQDRLVDNVGELASCELAVATHPPTSQALDELRDVELIQLAHAAR